MRTLHRLNRDPMRYYLSQEMSAHSVRLPILSRSCKGFGLLREVIADARRLAGAEAAKPEWEPLPA